MPLTEIAFVKVQKRAGGSFLVTIPSDAVKALKLVDNERMKVLLDVKEKRVTFELVEG
jgi:antitoxin component of MazEF toxin-antitoxin module